MKYNIDIVVQPDPSRRAFTLADTGTRWTPLACSLLSGIRTGLLGSQIVGCLKGCISALHPCPLGIGEAVGWAGNVAADILRRCIGD